MVSPHLECILLKAFNSISCRNEFSKTNRSCRKTEYRNTLIIDMWFLGYVLLEIIGGIPLWMNPLCWLRWMGDDFSIRLFVMKGRKEFQEIINKQREVI